MVVSASHKKHAVIFGGSGFVGHNLIPPLVRNGWTISVVTRRPHRHRDLLVFPGLQMIECRDFSRQSIEAFVRRGDTVVNLVGILNASRGNSFDRLHSQLPADIAHACLIKNARRLVHIGSIGADVSAPSQYLRSKGSGQQAVVDAASEGLDCIVIRPSIIFGADDSFSQKFAQLLRISKWIFPLVCPDAKMQPVFIDDVVGGIMHAMAAQTLNAQVVDIAGPQILTLYQVVDIINSLCGTRLRIIGLNNSLSMAVGAIAQFAPGQPISADNIRSLQIPNVLESDFPEPFGMQTRSFEETAKSWLARQQDPFNALRTHAGR